MVSISVMLELSRDHSIAVVVFVYDVKASKT